MKQYYERRITYNPETQNYHVTVPELGLEVQSDTEVSGLVEMREEVARAARNPKPVPELDIEPFDSLFSLLSKDAAKPPATLPIHGWGSINYPPPSSSGPTTGKLPQQYATRAGKSITVKWNP